MITEEIKIQKIIASEGMVLFNGETYGREVYLGKYDSPSNWREIPETEVEEEILVTL